MTLPHLDAQMVKLRHIDDTPDIPEHIWAALASYIHAEVSSLGDPAINRLRLAMPIPPERYLEELSAYQSWMDLAHRNSTNPVIVRAQIMTELYVSFIWLRDSVFEPVASALPCVSDIPW